jgi:hypothetical protein
VRLPAEPDPVRSARFLACRSRRTSLPEGLARTIAGQRDRLRGQAETYAEARLSASCSCGGSWDETGRQPQESRGDLEPNDPLGPNRCITTAGSRTSAQRGHDRVAHRQSRWSVVVDRWWLIVDHDR